MAEKEMFCVNPKCGAPIGWTIEVEGILLCNVGGILASKIDGVCVNCGKKFHWSMTDNMLENLIERVKSHKE